jgi:hypothetical protein
MCTVSVVRPLIDRVTSADVSGLVRHRPFRLVMNRDEQRTRTPGTGPRTVDLEGLRVVMPIDPDGGGTWVAASDAGLAFAILNATDDADDARGLGGFASRGAIIPQLAGSESIDEAARRLIARDWRAYRPWRLVMTDGARLVSARPVSGRVRVTEDPLPRAFMTTSSSRDETRAAFARARLFHELVRHADDASQDAFHAHQWTDRTEISVRMDRADARTVSRTVVEVRPGDVVMTVVRLDAVAPAPMRAGLERPARRAGAA